MEDYDFNRFVILSFVYKKLAVPIGIGAIEVFDGVNTLDAFVEDISGQQGVDPGVVENIMYGVE